MAPENVPLLQKLLPFRLGHVLVEPAALRLSSARGESFLEPKVMSVLVALAERPGNLWQRSDLLDKVWPASPSGDEVLTRAISLLRKALEGGHGLNCSVVTVPKLGYRLVADVHAEAPQTAMPAEAPARRSIAVLAFADLSAAGDQGHFADGVSEEIINALVRVPDLQVAGRTSSFAYKGRDTDLRKIGAELAVDFILEGSVRKQDNRLRITAQLVQTKDGFHQWSETFNGTLDDIFDLQDRIAVVIARQLDLLLNSGPQARLSPRMTNSFEAYDLMLRARAAYRLSPDAETFACAEALLNEAVQIDPDFAEAWVAIATLHNFAAASLGDRSVRAAFEASKAAIERASRLAPTNATTVIWNANIRYFEGDSLTAFQLARTALALEPENPAILFSVAHYATCFGYHGEARRLLERALSLDPLDGFAWHTLARVNQNLGHLETAVQQAERAVELGDVFALDALAWIALQQGDPVRAQAIFLDLHDRMGSQLEGGADSRQIWEMFARGVFRDSEADVEMMRMGLRMRMATPGYEPNASTFVGIACVGMVEELFAQWKASYVLKSTVAVALWSGVDWARKVRTHAGFTAFAEANGLAAIWRQFGWPDGIVPIEGTDGSNGQFTAR